MRESVRRNCHTTPHEPKIRRVWLSFSQRTRQPMNFWVQMQSNESSPWLVRLQWVLTVDQPPTKFKSNKKIILLFSSKIFFKKLLELSLSSLHSGQQEGQWYDLFSFLLRWQCRNFRSRIQSQCLFLLQSVCKGPCFWCSFAGVFCIHKQMSDASTKPSSSNKPPPSNSTNTNMSTSHMSTIQPLSQASITRLVAEQAIVDLPSIVKELVDNALDAQATHLNSKSLLMLVMSLCLNLSWLSSLFFLTLSLSSQLSISYLILNKSVCLDKDWTLSKCPTMASVFRKLADHCCVRDMPRPNCRTLSSCILLLQVVAWDFEAKPSLVWPHCRRMSWFVPNVREKSWRKRWNLIALVVCYPKRPKSNPAKWERR